MSAVKSRIVFVIDESGSMANVRDVTINGFNEQVQTILDSPNKDNTTVSLFTFSNFNKIREVFFEVPATELRELTREDYNPRGSTALWDAMAYAILRLFIGKPVRADENVTVIVMTDGYENGSLWMVPEQLRRLVQNLTSDKKWTLTFIGANVDLNRISAASGVPVAGMVNYHGTHTGTQNAYRGISRSLSNRLYENARGVVEASANFWVDPNGSKTV